MDLDRAVVDDAASNVSAPAQGTALVESRLETLGQGEEAREAFLHMMSNWCNEFIRANPNAQPPPPPPIPQPTPVAPQVVELVRRQKPPIDRIRNKELRSFDLVKMMIWKEHNFGLNIPSGGGTPLCRLYQGRSLIGNFSKKSSGRRYISQRFINQKRNEFLELKQGRMTVTKYEREFVRFSKYARECVSIEAIMCKRFEDRLNEDIQLYVGVLELKEFVVLVDRACKADELAKEKRKVEIESRDSDKRQLGKSFQSSSKNLRDFTTRSATSTGFSIRSKGKQYSGSKAQTTSVASVGNAQPSRQNVLNVVDIIPMSVEQM
ncbi:Gag-Pol polyprotein [Gossypium australe]|uniref:Gag-Pol polyprotein n=1 Tax=Gossypium australe TaxID=47621 RepID=A0A5B6WG33_9ROSI|nr:Gag-Pol polyprotein [Gossypium australe]